MMKEINIADINGFLLGHAENPGGGTGVTVILCDKGDGEGVCASVDIRGGGPASRETPVLEPEAACEAVNAIVLSGGSAFGLEAACGVSDYLYEKGIGFDTGFAKVPIVCGSSLYDLAVGDVVWPDKSMGRAACLRAEKGDDRSGNVGAGTGATAGKLRGVAGAMKSGIASYAVQVGEFKIGAVVAANPLGDIVDPGTGKIIAGLLDDEGRFLGSEKEIAKMITPENLWVKDHQNTTIGAVLCNGDFSKRDLKRIAMMAHDGIARAIRPVHTTADGDSLYAAATGDVKADVNAAGALAATCVAGAIVRAALDAEDAYGFRAAAAVDDE